MACSKILERVVTNQLLEYFRRNNYLTSRQFGYMQNVSTGDAVVDIVDFLYDCFDVGETALGVFLDLSKAFDTLDREILFAKLRYHGVGEYALAWFRSYFRERQQCVRYKGIYSFRFENYGVRSGTGQCLRADFV